MNPDRKLLPSKTSSAVDAGPQSQATEEPSPHSITRPKRRGPLTIAACFACRRKRIKCDGRRPVCSRCAAITSQPTAACAYGIEPNVTRNAAMKKQNAELCQHYECMEIIHRMREVNLGNDLDHHFEFVKSGRLHTDPIADPIDDGPEEPTPETADSIVLPGASIDEATALLKDL
ncbi:hypothetical protein VDGL01_11114 [Verticillium dahliae]